MDRRAVRGVARRRRVLPGARGREVERGDGGAASARPETRPKVARISPYARARSSPWAQRSEGRRPWGRPVADQRLVDVDVPLHHRRAGAPRPQTLRPAGRPGAARLSTCHATRRDRAASGASRAYSASSPDPGHGGPCHPAEPGDALAEVQPPGVEATGRAHRARDSLPNLMDDRSTRASPASAPAAASSSARRPPNAAAWSTVRIVSLLFHGALRRSEVAALCWADVDFRDELTARGASTHAIPGHGRSATPRASARAKGAVSKYLR